MKKILMIVVMMASFSSIALDGQWGGAGGWGWHYQNELVRQAREREEERQRIIRENAEGEARHRRSLESKAESERQANERMNQYADQACCHIKLKYTCRDNGAIRLLVKAYQDKCIDFSKYKDLRTLRQIPICHPITHEYLGRCDTQDAGTYVVRNGNEQQHVSAFDDSCDIFHKLRRGEGHDKDHL